MHEVINVMLSRYSCTTYQDYQNALKEIIQEIALLGLWNIYSRRIGFRCYSAQWSIRFKRYD